MPFISQSPDWAKIKYVLKSLGIVFTGLISAVLAVWLFGPSSINIEGITIEAAIAPASAGITEFRLPPFGVIEARTHQGPVKFSLTLEQIQSDSLKTQINNPASSKVFLQRLRKGAEDSVLLFALRQIIMAFIASFLMILLIWRNSLFKALLNALLCIILLAIPVLYSVNSYNPQAFTEAEYKGVISMAPSLMEFAGNSLSDLQSIKENTDKIVANLRKVFIGADSLMVMASPEEQNEVVKVLLVSDLHSNPVGIEFIKSMADNFKVDFIINAGDLTDLGTIPEAESIKDIQNIKIPQLIAAGNHDNPEIMDIIAGYENCQVLNGQMTSISGIKVLGFPDPLSSVAAVEYASEEEGRQIMDEQAVLIKTAVETQGRPDILVVHNSSMGKQLMSLSAITVSGHDHRLRMVQQADSVFINPGTSGAAGLRGLYSEEDQAYSAAIAYLVPGTGLLATDLIEYNPLSKQFSIQRKLVNTSINSETSQ
ncbi:MAG: metallophosphoesterase family protein [Syntrophomonadaceae bacterium]|nr:metallophosphoesterase family protein [Syntrophomonadaceae bacterium]